jgi:hypothetical protein
MTYEHGDDLAPDALAAIAATSARHVDACAWLAASPDNALGRYRVLATRDTAAASLASDVPALLASLAAERTRREAVEASAAQLRADLDRADFDRQRVEVERDGVAEAECARLRGKRDALRLALATLAARERETAAERDLYRDLAAQRVSLSKVMDACDAAIDRMGVEGDRERMKGGAEVRAAILRAMYR